MSKSKKKNSNELNDSFLKENKIIFKKYKPIKEIGSGSFGKIYSTIRMEDKNVFAMKTEKKTSYNNSLETEAYYLLILKGLGIPELISYGQNAKYNILIETLLNKSLFDMFIRPKKPCNITDVCFIALQLIERLEFIHSKNIIYRDVKPENFMIGMDDPNVIYIIDYGLCKKYRSSKTGRHIQPRYINKFIGTLKYASSNVIKGKESSRRDDLISLGFALIHLYSRNLPWNTTFQSLNKLSYLNILHSKETFDDGKLFHHLPEEMVDFLKYVNNLRFEQDPNYSFMKGCFFSWITSKNIKLVPKINIDKTESSRNRILKSLEKNKSKKSTFDTDNNINNPKEIENTSDENEIKNNEKEKNNDLIGQQKHKDEIVINIRNKTNHLQENIKDNNNNIFQNNINLLFDMNDKNRHMNADITYHKKINTFAPENILENNLTDIHYPFSSKDNNNNYSNYSLNKSKNMIIINSNISKKYYNEMNAMNNLM